MPLKIQIKTRDKYLQKSIACSKHVNILILKN